MLGTVQFGLRYGIANRNGQPSYETARAILVCAYEGGVNCLDTASAYGTSEGVIGKVLSELGIADRMVVVSKVYPMAGGFSSRQAADAFVEESVTRSLKRLRLDVLPICLFHWEENFCYVESLLRLKEKRLVRHIGSSVMTPGVASRIVSSGLAEAVQIPASLLNHRFPRSGICEEARRRGTAIFARSVYLQGLLLMPEEDIPDESRFQSRYGSELGNN
jgi:aryl-alcohol dehydrogenase-like predicted oxidoreductase